MRASTRKWAKRAKAVINETRSADKFRKQDKLAAAIKRAK